jgi:imidazolonepropionase-like amidohydrolase
VERVAGHIGETVLRGGRLIDGTGRDPIDDAGLVIAGGRIRQVDGSDRLRFSRDARVIDVDAQSILPGLIDCHTHLSYHASRPDAWALENEEPVELTAIKAALNARAILAMGFTTIGDGGCRGLVGPAVRDAITEGLVAGPRVLAAGQILCGTAGLLDSAAAWLRCKSDVALGRVVNGPEEVRQAVRQQIKGGVDFVKVSASGVAGSRFSDAETDDLDEDELRAAVREAARHRRWVHAHAHSTQGIKAAVRAGVRSLHSGEFADDEALVMMRERGVILAVTIAWLHVRCLPSYVLARDNPAFVAEARRAFLAGAGILVRARELGVRVAVGTDAAHRFPHAPDGILELEYLAALGYSPLEVIRAATQTAAEALVRGGDLGTLEPGKLADVLVVDGDPASDVGVLRDKRRIVMMLKEGREVALAADRRPSAPDVSVPALLAAESPPVAAAGRSSWEGGSA